MSAARIKICGLTTPDDARLAAGLGADYLGVIFAESARRVDVARAAEIRAAAPSVPLVGVFRDPALDDVVDAVCRAGLDLVQLHGRESPAACADVLHRTGKPVIKTFNSNRVPDADELATFTTTSYFLFDADKSRPLDATAATDRWERVARVRGLGFRVFLAGALDAGNVGDAVRIAGPFAVDVCRGVEREPGVKDPEALRRFIAAVRS